MGLADMLAEKMKGPKKGADESGKDEESTETDEEKGGEAAMGRALIAAIKSGDGEAVYEAVMACK